MEARVDELLEQRKDFNGCLVIDDPEYRGEPRVTTRLFGKTFHEGLKTLEDWLVQDDLFNIGIYGPGGVGKTTLAQHIHNHLLETTNFKVLWVSVSQGFSLKKLQDDIAKLVKLDLSDEEDEDRRAAMLSRSLVQKSVFILDGVWEEFCLEKIGILLGTNRCRLILTTRSLELCHRMHCQKQLKLKTLGTYEAWDLFKHKLGPETVLSEEKEKIAILVAERCAGLPLGIIAVAGSMRGVIDIREWRNALEQLQASSIGYEEMENEVFPILEWSFNRLNECERHCFLYICLYSEGYRLEREKLVNLFISAELFPRRNTRESELDYGHKILNKLVKVCLVEEEMVEDLDEGFLKIHDIIRDMARRITCGKSTSKITGNVPRFLVKSIEISNWKLEPFEWNENLNAVSFARCNNIPGGGTIEIPLGMSPKCPNLSTILFSHAKIKRIPDSFFRQMDGLKVLNLELCHDLEELPECISDLVNLNALLIFGCTKLRAVPPLGNLYKLRELDLSYTLIDDLPQGFEELVKLEHFWMYGGRLMNKIIPKGTFSKFHHLRQLVLPVHFSGDLEVWKQLQVFGGHFTFKDFCDQLITFQCWPKRFMISVVHKPCTGYHALLLSQFNLSEENVLNFTGCNLSNGLDVDLLPEDVRYLGFRNCSGLSNVIFQRLVNRFNSLSNLQIRSSKEVQFLLNLSNYACPLQNLKNLDLYDLPNFVGLVNLGLSSSSPSEAEHLRGHQKQLIPPEFFSSLKSLSISRCHKLKRLFPMQLLLQNFQNLKSFSVNFCDQLECIVATDDHLGGVGEQVTGPATTTTSEVRLPKLERFYLQNLPGLEYICEATMICDSIEYFVMFNCTKVKRLPSFLPINATTGEPSPPTNLPTICASDDEWWDSLGPFFKE